MASSCGGLFFRGVLVEDLLSFSALPVPPFPVNGELPREMQVEADVEDGELEAEFVEDEGRSVAA